MVNLIHSLQSLKRARITAGWTIDGSGFESKSRIFHFSISSRPPPQWVPGCGAHPSPPTGALVKKNKYTSIAEGGLEIAYTESFLIVLNF
jgi:hypothetical protein